MQSKSEYFINLVGEDKHRYESKVTSLGLTSDPHSIAEWIEKLLFLISTGAIL